MNINLQSLTFSMLQWTRKGENWEWNGETKRDRERVGKRNCIARRLSNIILCGGRRRRSSIVVGLDFLHFHLRCHYTLTYLIFAGAVSMLPFAVWWYMWVCARDTRWLMTLPFLYSFHILDSLFSICISSALRTSVLRFECSNCNFALWQCFRTFVDCAHTRCI